ncbi:putative formate dehydrogenase accessory protein FdhD [Escherichia coli BCE034_MS-14]|nr:putative formate dehydrogenase accessory protein FdhD [Escherichia coli BCE034_MS-14]
MSGDKINVINWDYYASGWEIGKKVRKFDTSTANILLMILPFAK